MNLFLCGCVCLYYVLVCAYMYIFACMYGVNVYKKIIESLLKFFVINVYIMKTYYDVISHLELNNCEKSIHSQPFQNL